MATPDRRNRTEVDLALERDRPAIMAALTKASATREPKDFEAYLATLTKAYDRAGVPLWQRRAIPLEIADGIVKRLATMPLPAAMQGLRNARELAACCWAPFFRDLVLARLSPVIQTVWTIAEASPENADIALAALADASLGEEASGRRVGDLSLADVVEAAVDTDVGLVSLGASMGVGGERGRACFSEVQRVVRAIALYLNLRGAESNPLEAARRAAEMVTSESEFVSQPGHPPARLSRGATPAGFRIATRGALAVLRASERTSGVNLEGVYWITVPGADGKGAVRAFDPSTSEPLLLPDGATIEVAWADMATPTLGALA